MSGHESPPKAELPWTDVEVAKLQRTFPALSCPLLGRLQTFKYINESDLFRPSQSLEFLHLEAFIVAHQHPARLIPVGQYPALAGPAVHAVLVPGRPVRVTVNQARIAVLAQ